MARRQRNTNNRNSNSQSENTEVATPVVEPASIPLSQQDEKKSFWEKFNSTGGIAIVIITIFATGFGGGAYLNSIYNRIEKMEIDMQHQKEIEALKKEKYMTKEDVEEFINNYNKANDGSKQ